MTTNIPLDTIENLVFVPSRSRLSLAVERAGSFKEAERSYVNKERWAYLLKEDAALKVSIRTIEDAFPHIPSIDRGQIPESIGENNTLIIIGGDDFYTYCAGSVLAAVHNNEKITNTALMGINGKPAFSYGALLPFTAESAIQALRGELSTVQKPTPYLATAVENGNRKDAFPSVAQVAIGEYVMLDSSDHRVVLADGSEPLVRKGSGLLAALTTGSGLGSWYANAGGASVPEDAYGLLVREPSKRGVSNIILREPVTIYSSNDSQGCVSSDGHKERVVPFTDGAIATIERKLSPVQTLYIHK